jgi:hypothetical protein
LSYKIMISKDISILHVLPVRKYIEVVRILVKLPTDTSVFVDFWGGLPF